MFLYRIEFCLFNFFNESFVCIIFRIRGIMFDHLCIGISSCLTNVLLYKAGIYSW